TFASDYRKDNLLSGKPYCITFHGDKATLFVDHSQYELHSEAKGVSPVIVKGTGSQNADHWANFLDCVKTREKPAADIEICQRSTTTCLLANVSLRSGMRVDWDESNWTVKQEEARKFLSREDRAPWKLVV